MPDVYQWQGSVRTDTYCHACDRNFIAIIDFSLAGNHEVECPACGHKHYRVIKNGKVTSDRYDSDNSPPIKDQAVRDMWRSETRPMETSTTKHFLREKWLNRSDS